MEGECKLLLELEKFQCCFWLAVTVVKFLCVDLSMIPNSGRSLLSHWTMFHILRAILVLYFFYLYFMQEG